MISLKQMHYQPETMNNIFNKSKRREYVLKVMEAIGGGKYVIFVDESNVNLFLHLFTLNLKKVPFNSNNLPFKEKKISL